MSYDLSAHAMLHSDKGSKGGERWICGQTVEKDLHSSVLLDLLIKTCLFYELKTVRPNCLFALALREKSYF